MLLARATRQHAPGVARRQLCASAGAGGRKKRLVVLGTGWGGFHVARDTDKREFEVTLVSPVNHFLFTPLLPSTTVGTLEFRCIQEPVRTIQGLHAYYQAKALAVDFANRRVVCEDIFKNHRFDLPYDALVIAAGAKTNTFNTPGVAEREGREVHFLKHLYHARLIRNRALECFERASEPNTLPTERDRLLSFLVVGGGPTSVEFTGELYDFITRDVSRWYPDLRRHIRVTLVEASSHILGSFDQSLASYVLQKLRNRDIDIRLGTAVKAVENLHAPEDTDARGNNTPVSPGSCAVLSDGTRLPFGTMVWSAGLQPVKVVQSLTGLRKGPTGRLLVDEHLRVLEEPGGTARTDGRVFALGDCAVNEERPLAQLAKAAQQQGQFLAKALSTTYARAGDGSWANVAPPAKFAFSNLGSMAQIGSWDGVLDMTHVGGKHRGPKVKGLAAFLTWRSAYLGMQVSWANKLLIPMHWLKTLLFGRDISRF